MIVPNKHDRGEKRKCQNDECAAPFYDLNRAEFNCPVCDTPFDHEFGVDDQVAPEPPRVYRKEPRRLPIVAPAEPGLPADQPDDLDGSEAPDSAATDAAIGEPADILLDDDEDEDIAEAVPLASSDDNQER